MKMNSRKKQKHWYQINTWSEKAFKGTVVNRALSSLHREGHTLTVPFTRHDELIIYMMNWFIDELIIYIVSYTDKTWHCRHNLKFSFILESFEQRSLKEKYSIFTWQILISHSSLIRHRFKGFKGYRRYRTTSLEMDHRLTLWLQCLSGT